MPLTLNDIEAELSYAYLHAVASRAGLNCQYSNRNADNYGVDATIEHFDVITGTYIKDVTLRVQLKATKNKGKETSTHIQYTFKGIPAYDKLRQDFGQPHRILIVLFLTNDESDWLKVTVDELLLKNSAYWVCLYGAPQSANQTGETIYIPKANLLTPQSLRTLCQDIGRGNIPMYIKP